MAIDAGMLRQLAMEINSRGTCRVDKIYQPSEEEIIFLLRTQNGNERLLINAGSNHPRIHFTKTEAENPQKAPMFCMLLRKYLQGGKMLSCETIDYERICRLGFEAYDEMGFISKKYLYFEMMGTYSNVILTNDEDKIIALLKVVEFSDRNDRALLCGLTYQKPKKQEKEDTLTVTEERFLQVAKDRYGMKIDRFISSCFMGIVNTTSRQIAFLTERNIDAVLTEENALKVYNTLFPIIEGLKNGTSKPYFIKQNNQPIDFSYIPLTYYGNDFAIEEKRSFSELMDCFFEEKAKTERIAKKSQDISRLLTNAENRISKKTENQTVELSECREAELYKKKGDLVISNIYLLKKGQNSFFAVDYSDENLTTLQITLDPRLTPSQNAQKYYKKYAKLRNAKEILTEQIRLGKEELSYIQSVKESLKKAETESDLQQIRVELFKNGYQKKLQDYSKSKQIKSAPLSFVTTNGYTVLCGKNNLQNEEITLKIGEKYQWWFHVKNFHGSHVLLQNAQGEEPPPQDFTDCAEIAAFYSQADGENIEVDYTLIKNVKKPSGAKTGMVVYTSNYTAVVSPNEAKIKQMKKK